MTTVPRLSIGLPVYNGENFLAEALDALLGQTFSDFELIISDNASTDGTEAICRRYAAMDTRIRYIRQPRNIGARPNHNFLVEHARGELFKWASHDDLYGRELLAACVTALDEHPEAVLSHADQAIINEKNQILTRCEYTLDSGSAYPPDRLRSMLLTEGGDDEYGVIRTSVLRATRPNDSYHNSSRPFIAELALRGPFYHVPELLYFRRDHPNRGDRNPTIRALCANLDPRRARHSTARLVTEYVWGFVGSISRAPLATSDRWRCYGHLAHWLARGCVRRVARRSLAPVMGLEDHSEPTETAAVVAAIVEGRERSAS
ncbi:MAG: glycosyltransferase [Actinophytocola sp.]|nr:glycosyltransferase [Actinophytocola sp.]